MSEFRYVIAVFLSIIVGVLIVGFDIFLFVTYPALCLALLIVAHISIVLIFMVSCGIFYLLGGKKL